VEFEKRKELEVAREIAREELARHKIVKPKPARTLKLMAENGQSKKVFLPLNKYHPPSGLFVKDCNEQCNDDLVLSSLFSSTAMRPIISNVIECSKGKDQRL
jgi:hypothetical protein